MILMSLNFCHVLRPILLFFTKIQFLFQYFVFIIKYAKSTRGFILTRVKIRYRNINETMIPQRHNYFFKKLFELFLL